jgi:Flp pilus assembly protein TadG
MIWQTLQAFVRDRRAELDEAALVMPVLLLVTFGLVNLAMLGYAGMAANNAANYGARVASVAQSNQAGQAYAAASAKLNGITAGTYSVAVLGGGAPGSLVRVQVTYSVPNWFRPFAAIFGASSPAQLGGTARSDFRQEGW